MRQILLFLIVMLTGCAHNQTAIQNYDKISRYLTPELVNRHLMNGTEPSPKPIVETRNEQLLVEFDGHCLATIGKGSTFFSEAEYKKVRSGFFSSILGEGLSPKIGRRAYIYGIEQEIAVFTTTDGRFDIRIDPQGAPQPVDVVGLAKELSELYDKGLKD